MPLSFDIVIATRNRPEALALSIPLMLSQSRRPGKLIVIDSSDDHASVADTVAQAAAGWNGEVIVEHSAPGLPHQRNIGLAHVRADVVLFPDDDSLFHPGTSQAIMEVYERDTEGVIAGVCAVPDLSPPAGVLPEGTYRMTQTHQREARGQRLRSRLDKRLSHLNPAKYVGQALIARQNRPDWVGTFEVPLVEYMTGFRMSFRTDRIRVVGFDETLSGYGLNEDIDASLAVAHDGLLVGARPARIYHHRFPGGRPEPFRSAAIGILNPVYVISKHIGASPLSDTERRGARARLRAFMRLQLLAAVLAAFRPGGGKRLRGALAAYREGFRLLSVPQGELSAAYRAAERRMGL